MSDRPAAGAAPSGSVGPLIERLAAALQRGEVVLIPTDTVYGIAALPSVPGATAELYALKGRGADTPLAVLVSGPAEGRALGRGITPAVERITDRLWPGPLTVVIERDPEYRHWELGGDPTTIGVRCPDHDLVRALAGRVGPIATTSANRHGQPTPIDPAGALASLDGPVAVVLDEGPLGGVASTVVDATGPRWRVLRAGPLELSEIETASNP